jgi:3' exoribonuclease, RNase T-like
MNTEAPQKIWREGVTNYMVDLETYGLKPDSVILSLGMCRFNWAGPGFGFYQTYNPLTQYGRTKDLKTEAWWATQPNPPIHGTLDLRFGLEQFINLLQQNKFHTDDKIEIWAQGTDFDIIKLEHAMDSFGLEIPWGYNAKSDLRTLRKYNDDIYVGNITNAEKHNAMSDAIYQAKIASRILNILADRRM